MKDWLLEHKFYVVIAFVIGLSSIYYLYNNKDVPVASESISIEKKLGEKREEKTNNKQKESQEKTEQIMVDVKGQIKQPGVYQANTGERVIDVISRAGGLTDQADQTQINFAEHVADEMVVYVPAKGEAADAIAGNMDNQNATGSRSQEQGKININKADTTELQNLPGIGPSKADAILEYRNTNGPFKTVEDLKNISGIGEKTFEKLKDLIVVR
ncbi:competence protein ComEA [Bacillus sp. SORGH_AS 510]|uniref:helix-hairpin-helix domain-containing protein n=1 Tax=Bacillus sp. SORGH_AS_0510 TaxID=3041771 RepID=UPI0027837B4D|nr:helix-hairpin-helix domain-containing protein [Bacillus sp. SORGH_AS_0510]MDQ1144969.1 competence protein ComEA [Bacillus sp. SORGH_AS_0510]